MTYDASWDAPHPPSRDPYFQESDCYWAYDPGAGIGLYHRVGQYLNQGTGQIQLFVFRREGQRFRLVNRNVAGGGSRTPTGQRVGSSFVDALSEMRMRYGWDEPECAADLEFYRAFYTPINWRQSEQRYHGAFHSDGHLECSGRIAGTLRIGREEVRIDALAHRDRSWGARPPGKLYQHRMSTGSAGPELSWVTVCVQMSDGGFSKSGYVIRNGVAEDVRDFDILATVDFDSLTIVDTVTRLRLRGGGAIDVRGHSEQCFGDEQRDGTLAPTCVTPVVADGLAGFTYCSIGVNPAKGTYVPRQAEVGTICIENGLSDWRRPPASALCPGD